MITITYVYTGNDRIETEMLFVSKDLLSTVLQALITAGVKILEVKE